MILRRAIVVSVLFALLTSVWGQSVKPSKGSSYPKVQTRVVPTSGTVGQHFKLNVTATVPDLKSLQVLPLFETQTSWTVVGQAAIKDEPAGSNQARTFSYTIVPFETGRYQTPKIAVTYAPDGSTSNTVLSEGVKVDIKSVLSGNGSASSLREVKPPVALPVPSVVIWSGSIFLLLVIALIVFWLWRRYSKRLRNFIGRALTPPELALKQMKSLEAERLIEHKKIKEYYTRLSDTMREYLEAAYGVPATELTSNELLYAMDELATDVPSHRADAYRKAMARLTEMLDEADLVKFARLMPEPSRCRKALDSGRDVVQLTRYRFQVESEESAKQSNRRSQNPPPPPQPATEVAQ